MGRWKRGGGHIFLARKNGGEGVCCFSSINCFIHAFSHFV